ncbi:MAG: type IV secretion system protein, partial [Novosphingobium sp.]
MTCAAFTTGSNFLSGIIAHVDCQAATLGTSGFAALSDPSSGVIIALTSLLTLFIALFGIRMMLGRDLAPSDLVGDVIKVGIVLTLATSWPAWRIVGYDVVMKAPQELAGSVGRASGLGVDGNSFLARLQNADDGMVAMTMAGSGRLTGGVAAGTDLGDSPRGVAVTDQFGLGMGRTAYLIGTIAPLAIVRLAGGILIALAPLMAGLLLFAGTSGVFFGWLRALGAAMLGNLALIL